MGSGRTEPVGWSRGPRADELERKYVAANKARCIINREIKEHGKKALRLEAKWAIETRLEELYA